MSGSERPTDKDGGRSCLPAAALDTEELINLFGEIAGRDAIHATKATHDRYFELRGELKARIVIDDALHAHPSHVDALPQWNVKPTAEQIETHYPDSQHQPDECEMCRFIHDAAKAYVEAPQAVDSVTGSATQSDRPADVSAPSSERPMNCREAGKGRGLCEPCANGHYEKCLYVARAPSSIGAPRKCTRCGGTGRMNVLVGPCPETDDCDVCGGVGQLMVVATNATASVAGRPRGAYVPLTVQEIDTIRLWLDRRAMLDKQMTTLCDMAVNCLLYAESATRAISLTKDELQHLAEFHESNGHSAQAEYFRTLCGSADGTAKA